MKAFLIILLVFLLIAVCQLTLKLKVRYNLILNQGKIQLRFVGIRVFDRDIKIFKNNILLISKNHKTIYLPIEFSKESIQSYVDFEGILFQKIYAKELTFYFNFGIKDNPSLSSNVCGFFDVFSKIVYSNLSQKKKDLIFRSKVYPSFQKSVIKFQIKGKISLSLYDLLWSFVEANVLGLIKKLKQKDIKYGRKKQN